MTLAGSTRRRTGTRTRLLVLVGAGACAAPLSAQTMRYTITDLGTVAGGNTCCFFGVALSNQGHVVGRFFGADGRYHGFFWHQGVMVDIGALPGGSPTQVLDVNDSGVATGHSMVNASSEHAFTFQNGVMTDIGTLGGSYSHGHAINNAGAIAGDAETNGRDDLQRAALWVNGHATDLGTFGGEFSNANGISDAGHVVGWAWDSARRVRAFLWTEAGGMIDLGDLGAGSAVAAAVNGADQVVGGAPAGATGRNHAFIWAAGVMRDLGVLPEAGLHEGIFGPELVETGADAINSDGQVVGNSYPGSLEPPLRPGPFIWEDGRVMRNLNDLIEPSSGWIIEAAADINDTGQIAGTARAPAGNIRAVLLTPVACRADFNGSGAANSQDFFDYLAAFFAGGVAADYNADGLTNSQDFFEFLGEFFAGCA